MIAQFPEEVVIPQSGCHEQAVHPPFMKQSAITLAVTHEFGGVGKEG